MASPSPTISPGVSPPPVFLFQSSSRVRTSKSLELQGESSRSQSNSPERRNTRTQEAKRKRWERDPNPDPDPDRGVYLIDVPAKSGAASDKTIQKFFLQMIGFIKIIQPTNIGNDELTNEEAMILANANSHKYYRTIKEASPETTDGYYTDEKLEAAIKQMREQKDVELCSCLAHRNLDEKIKTIIRTPPNLNNDQGKHFATTFMKKLFMYTHSSMSVIATEQGSEFCISYVLLNTEMSEEMSFDGWPDIAIVESAIGAEIIVLGVGEIESQGKDVIAQIGIYAIGQFKNCHIIKSNRMPCVAIFKDKTVVICLAEIEESKKVRFFCINGLNHMDLKSSEGVKTYAKTLLDTIRFANE